MSLDVIQGPLLTLFESSKEGDTKKIGKYGRRVRLGLLDRPR
jgi:hypothetical protein